MAENCQCVSLHRGHCGPVSIDIAPWDNNDVVTFYVKNNFILRIFSIIDKYFGLKEIGAAFRSLSFSLRCLSEEA
jgi:hypothetical protein